MRIHFTIFHLSFIFENLYNKMLEKVENERAEIKLAKM